MEKIIFAKMKQTFLIGLLVSLGGELVWASPPWQITQYMDRHPGKYVALNAGAEDGLKVDAVLGVYRRPSADFEESLPLICTGKIKIDKLEQNTAIGKVIEEESDLSRNAFPDYPGIMAGDQVDFPVFNIARIQEIIPELVVPYFKIFMDPQALPHTYELSEEGKKLLEDAVQVFAKEQSGLLLIKGFTDRNGQPEQNQIESYQRALTIRQFLVNALQFDEERIIALGIGEKDPVDRSRVPGYEKFNRRIEMKIIPFPHKK